MGFARSQWFWASWKPKGMSATVRPSSTDQFDPVLIMWRKMIVDSDPERKEHLSKTVRIAKKGFRRRAKPK
jgi:hypothetical protein